MSVSKLERLMRPSLGVLTLLLVARTSWADVYERLRVPIGRAIVVSSDDQVRTVAIAEPKIADAAVGSARTIVVNGKAPGYTSLVVYNEGNRYQVYDVEVYTPNSDKQVALHCRVAEVNETGKRELGFDLTGEGHSNRRQLDGTIIGGFATTKAGVDGDGFVHYVRNANDLILDATWRALEEKGDIRVLANPVMVARSGDLAKFHAGGEFPVPVPSGGSGTNVITVTIEWKEFGVKLDFTPTVEEDGSITLKVAPEVSQLDFSNNLVLAGFTVPTIITRKTSTTVHLNSGQHLVIGGLKQSEKLRTVKKVPVLGSIPILGFFFTSTKTETQDKELMVVVSPEILTTALNAVPKLPTDEPQKK